MSSDNSNQETDVSPAVQAIKETGGKVQGEMAMKSEKKGQERAARMVVNKGRSKGTKIAANTGKKFVPGTTPESQPHEQGWGK